MLNIELQSCALVMLLVLLFIFIGERALDLRSRMLYLRALISCIICLILDISSIIGISAANAGTITPGFARLICKLYICSLVIQSYEGLQYAAGEFYALDAHKKIRRFFSLTLVLGVILVAILPINYFIMGRVVFSYGPSTVATYVFTLLYIGMTIALAFYKSDTTSGRRRRAILCWQGCWLCAALVQLTHPTILVVGMAAAFGMMILYAELENPHEGIDRATGLYTSNALLDYMRDRYDTGRHFSSIFILVDYATQSPSTEVERTVMIRMANYLRRFSGTHCFRQSDKGLTLLFEEGGRMDSLYQTISEELPIVIGYPVRLHYILLRTSKITDRFEECINAHSYLLTQMEGKKAVEMDADTIAHIKNYATVREMIEDAMKDGRVEVFFQPIYNVKEKIFSSAEALVRIRDEDGRVVPPGMFIPVAEENGLIIPLGEEIFRQVCALLATGKPQEYGIQYIEVNLSVAQFDQEDLADRFIAIMEEYGIKPYWLNLEITETASSSAKRILLSNMKKLKEKGVTFSLDDFGTGRSNLDYFVEMPVEIIKFDYSFTQAYFTSKKARAVMESVITMMHRMGLFIVSEGVETRDQLDAMAGLGVNYIQGYYFSKPIPRDEFTDFLKDKNPVW